MSNSAVHETIENVIDAVADCLDSASAAALLRLEAPGKLQTRIESLAERCTEGALSDAEREEYEALIRVGNFVALLQARAQRRLAGSAV